MEPPRETPEPGRPSRNEDSDGINSIRVSKSSSQNSAGIDQEGKNDSDLSDSPKAADILAACKWRDIGQLRLLAEAEGGFLTDALRRQACTFESLLFPKTSPLAYMSVVAGPVLLGLKSPTDDATVKGSNISHGGPSQPDASLANWKELPPHRDEDQVQLDVNRSFIYYPSRK